jgi:enoyl-CoA hydratase/carnithine racemase
MFKPETALRIGLVDELAKDKADAIEKCKNYILSFKNISGKIVIVLHFRFPYAHIHYTFCC